MSTTIIFWTQIVSFVTFIVVLFSLYRHLVDTKDATIQLLKENISSLEGKLADAKTTSPDVLVKQYAYRVNLLNEELIRLSKDQEKNSIVIEQKENQLEETQAELMKLKGQMELALKFVSEFFCPYCKAPMLKHDFFNETVEYEGRDAELDHEFIEYECGLTVKDGHEETPCSNT